MMDDQPRYERVRVEDKQGALVVYFTSSRIHSDVDLEEIGRELLSIVDVAASRGKPLLLSLRGMESVSSAFLGKLVVVHQRTKDAGVAWRLCDAPPAIAEMFRIIWPDDGPAGVFAVPKPPPKNDSGRAYPEGEK